MKRQITILFMTLLMLSFFAFGCSIEEATPITVPDIAVEETPVEKPLSEPVPETPVIEETSEAENDTEEKPEYPYWWELHDFNADQEILTQDGEIKNLTLQPGNQPDELYVTWFSRSSSQGKVTFHSDKICVFRDFLFWTSVTRTSKSNPKPLF